jgi:hypothetical protein
MNCVVFFLVGLDGLWFIGGGIGCRLLIKIAAIGDILIEMSGRFIGLGLEMIGCKLDIKLFFLFLKLFNSSSNFNNLII